MEIQLKNIFHSFENLKVLEQINLTVHEGEILCIIGPSGCGKSTLLQIMGGMLKPTSGQTFQLGESPKNCLNALTYIFQDFALLPWRTVFDNISLVLEDHPLSSTQRSHIIENVLKRTGLHEFHSVFPNQLSGGMRQRVGIARAFAVNPAVLLMDEPLSALDAQTRELLLEDFIDLWLQEQITAAYVTHNLHEAVHLAHRVVVLSRRPARIKEIVKIDTPLQERRENSKQSAEIRHYLWDLIREEASIADREISQ